MPTKPVPNQHRRPTTKPLPGKNRRAVPAIEGTGDRRSALLHWLIPVLFHEGPIAAVAKPAGVDTGDGRDEGPTGLVEIINRLKLFPERFRAANRLSRYESGILMLAAEGPVVERVRADFRNGEVECEFHAVVGGRMKERHMRLPRAPKTIKPVHRGEGKRRGREKADPARDRATLAKGGVDISLVQQAEKRALIRCATRSANTHALRALLRSSGHRLLGDPLHDLAVRPQLQVRTSLHLTQVVRGIPGEKNSTTIRSSLPTDFHQCTTSGRPAVDRALYAAAVRRTELFVSDSTDAMRHLSGDFEDVPGLVVEQFGPLIVLQIHDDRETLGEQTPRIARFYRERFGAKYISIKRFGRDRRTEDASEAPRSFLVEAGGEAKGRRQTGSLKESESFVGRIAPETILVRENGLAFEIRPQEPWSVGMFLDHRDNRLRVRNECGGKTVLNLFSYTCGFSIAAAVGGAAQTVNVDLSQAHLDWGRSNYSHNGLQASDHEFVRADAREFCRDCIRTDRRFDLVILDPPTFAHGRRSNQSFSLVHDIRGLAASAAALLHPGGVLMAATNYRKMSQADLRKEVRAGLGSRSFQFLEPTSIPVDFAMDPSIAKTVWAKLG